MADLTPQDRAERKVEELEAEVERLNRELSDQSETIQRHYPTPLQWQQARARIGIIEATLEKIGSTIGSWHLGDPLYTLESDVRTIVENLRAARKESV